MPASRLSSRWTTLTGASSGMRSTRRMTTTSIVASWWTTCSAAIAAPTWYATSLALPPTCLIAQCYQTAAEFVKDAPPSHHAQRQGRRPVSLSSSSSVFDETAGTPAFETDASHGHVTTSTPLKSEAYHAMPKASAITAPGAADHTMTAQLFQAMDLDGNKLLERKEIAQVLLQVNVAHSQEVGASSRCKRGRLHSLPSRKGQCHHSSPHTKAYRRQMSRARKCFPN